MTFAPSPLRSLILSSAALRASGQALLPLSAATEAAKASGASCDQSATRFDHNGLSWNSHPETRNGKPKSRAIFAGLATTIPELNLRLATLVRHIQGGACSYLPAPVCRDWRSPGVRSHPRLKASRGQPMPELIGTRISSELYEWMLALPVKWTKAEAESEKNGSKL